MLTRDSRDSSTSTAEAPRVQATAALSVALCLVYGIGCATVPEKPPRPWPCPQETLDVMWKELKLKNLDVIVDVNQPGHGGEHGVFRDGPITSQLARASGELPAGSLLFGQLWSGPDVYLLGTGRPAVMIRYTTAQRPDGKRFPVCIVIGSEDGRVHTRTGSQPGASVIPRRLPATAVWSWP